MCILFLIVNYYQDLNGKKYVKIKTFWCYPCHKFSVFVKESMEYGVFYFLRLSNANLHY